MNITALPLNKQEDIWHGCKRHSFKLNNCLSWIVEPAKPAADNPWIWCMDYPDAFTDRIGVPELLDRGFFHVYTEVNNTFSYSDALKQWDAFYEIIVKAGLAKQGTLVGLSRGGLYAYNWAALNPDKIMCIYGDAPVCNLDSWPGEMGTGQVGYLKNMADYYTFEDDAEALAWDEYPIDNLDVIAKARIPIIHVIGEMDNIVRPPENSDLIAERYKRLGGRITVIRKPEDGHHPHGLDDPAPIVEFIQDKWTAWREKC